MATAPMIISAPSAFATLGESVFSIESKSPILHKINPDTGATISAVVITLAGQQVNGGTGIAHNPADGKIYALLKIEDVSNGFGLDRHLATIDPLTGIATLVGDTGVTKIASLAMTNPSTLFSLSLRTADFNTATLTTVSTVHLRDIRRTARSNLPSSRWS